MQPVVEKAAAALTKLKSMRKRRADRTAAKIDAAIQELQSLEGSRGPPQTRAANRHPLGCARHPLWKCCGCYRRWTRRQPRRRRRPFLKLHQSATSLVERWQALREPTVGAAEGAALKGYSASSALVISRHSCSSELCGGSLPARPIPVGGIGGVAFLAMQVGVDPRGAGTFVLLRRFVGGLPIALRVPPQRRERMIQCPWRTIALQRFAEVIEGHVPDHVHTVEYRRSRKESLLSQHPARFPRKLIANPCAASPSNERQQNYRR